MGWILLYYNVTMLGRAGVSSSFSQFRSAHACWTGSADEGIHMECCQMPAKERWAASYRDQASLQTIWSSHIRGER